MSHTKEWFTEYKNSLKQKDNMKMLGLSFRFPVVLYRDFKSYSTVKKIIVISALVLIGIGLSTFEDKMNKEMEDKILKCDCSFGRENDNFYAIWYNTGKQYGRDIPQIINVDREFNLSLEPYSKDYFTIAWIKNYIYMKGSGQKGGYPEMKKYHECWEKGFLEGRNEYFDNKK